MVEAAAAQSDNGHAHAVIGSQYVLSLKSGHGSGARLQEISTIDIVPHGTS
jgi:hypothetical protein